MQLVFRQLRATRIIHRVLKDEAKLLIHPIAMKGGRGSCLFKLAEINKDRNIVLVDGIQEVSNYHAPIQKSGVFCQVNV